VFAPFLAFQLDQFEQVPLVAERFPFRMPRFFLKNSAALPADAGLGGVRSTET
jgi:hypothetical protein